MVDLARAFCAGTIPQGDLKRKWKAMLSARSTLVRVPFQKAVSKVAGPPAKASATTALATADPLVNVPATANSKPDQPMPAKADPQPKRVRVSKATASVPKGPPKKPAASKASCVAKGATKAAAKKEAMKTGAKVPAKAKIGAKVSDDETSLDSSSSD